MRANICALSGIQTQYSSVRAIKAHTPNCVATIAGTVGIMAEARTTEETAVRCGIV
jgi:hypothetical protein